jgi:hypothetical protein
LPIILLENTIPEEVENQYFSISFQNKDRSLTEDRGYPSYMNTFR